MDSLGFFYLQVMFSVNEDSFTSSFSIWILSISFSCLSALARNLEQECVEVVKGHPCLFHAFKGTQPIFHQQGYLL